MVTISVSPIMWQDKFTQINLAKLNFDRLPKFNFMKKDFGKITQLLIKDRLIQIEIAQTLMQKSKGLSHRLSLEKDHGMFFIFSYSGFHLFWMKGMKFGIDIIWIDENYKIIDISKNILPKFWPQFLKPNQPAQYVLEVNAGFSDMNKIQIGDEVELRSRSSTSQD